MKKDVEWLTGQIQTMTPHMEGFEVKGLSLTPDKVVEWIGIDSTGGKDVLTLTIRLEKSGVTWNTRLGGSDD